MHVLYISQYFPPEMGAPAARVYELSREWVRLGHRVTVLTGFPNHPTGVVPPAYRGRVFQRESVEGIEVVRTWLYPAPNRGRIRRMLNYVSFPMSALAMGVPSVRDVDVVIGTSPQFLVAAAGWAAGVMKSRPFVFEVRDLWPDSITAVGAVRNRLFIGGLRRVEEFLYRHADKIVAVARSTPRILVERGFDARSMVVVPNGVDLNFFRPGAPSDGLRRKLAPNGGFLTSYIGTHGMAHALETFLRSAVALRDDPRFRFLLVGEGAEKPRLLALAAELELDNVEFIGQQPRDRLPDFYRASDACLVPLRRSELFRSVLPSKMFEIMGCGRPILLSVEGEARELLDEAQAGIGIEPESVGALTSAIRYMADHPDEVRHMGERARAFVEASYSRTALARKYAHVLESVAGAHD